MRHTSARFMFAVAFLSCGVHALVACAPAKSGSTTASSAPFAAAPQSAAPASSDQRRFPTAEAATEALLIACESNDRAALLAMMGANHANLVESGDAALDESRRQRFAARLREHTNLVPLSDGSIELVAGNDRWPFPIPLVHESGGWRWDVESGADEVLSRRIGRNELAAIEICNAFVAAQAEYSRLDRDGDLVLEYAQKVLSSPGRHDGLYWPRQSDDAIPSPLDLLAQHIREELAGWKPGDPLAGYYFRILPGQGANVPGGQYNYIINGNMIAGFALVAWPADYGNSGIMTFVVSHRGIVHQSDLGEGTGSIAAGMRQFNPDHSWQPAE